MPGSRIVASVVIGLLVLWGGLAASIEGLVNRVQTISLPEVGPRARAVHDASWVVDLHADTLLWGRDPLQRGRLGHVDLPRLREGGVGLQFFTVVTRVPATANIDRTEDRLDIVTLLGCLQLSPSCWRGPFGRTRLQAERLEDAIQRDPKLLWVRSREELSRLRARRAEDPEVVGAVLGLEGAHALEGDPQRLEDAFALGVRMIGLTHFFDNEYAGSAHGVGKAGLSDLGRRTLARMEELGILVDLAHVSPAALDEILDRAAHPVVVSHGGVKGRCDSARTLSDAEVRRIAAGGGVIGIGYWKDAVCGVHPSDVAAAMRYVVDLVGDDHVGLGSDYDGATSVGFDTSRLRVLTQALVDDGFEAASIRKLLGGNVLRVLEATLP